MIDNRVLQLKREHFQLLLVCVFTALGSSGCVNNRILHYRVLTLISPPLTVLAQTPAPRFNVLILTSALRALLSLLLLPITHNAAINISQRQLFSIIFSARDCFRIRMETRPMFSMQQTPMNETPYLLNLCLSKDQVGGLYCCFMQVFRLV